MCGRYVLSADPAVVQQTFDLDIVPAQMQPRYNIAPSQPVAVIANIRRNELTHMKWGLVPSWSKDPSIGNKMFNARSETAAEKPSFRSAFKRRRCLIPADGFYEWVKDGSKRQPVYVHMKDRTLFAFAGLWETWRSPDGSELDTCTILTTTPNGMMKPLHHRMAVILDENDYDTWLSPDELPASVLMPLLGPFASDRMAYYPVSTAVNSPSNEGSGLIEPFQPPQQQSLL